jgi:hypothetical protein
MTEARTAWQQIMVTDEELHQLLVIERLFDRAQLRLRCKVASEHMEEGLWLEFDKLVVNHCQHPADARQSVVTCGFATDPPLPSCRMSCTLCWATVEASVHTNGMTAYVIYKHSTPLIASNANPYMVGNTVTLSSSSNYLNNVTFNITQMRIMENTTVTVSGTTMRDI